MGLLWSQLHPDEFLYKSYTTVPVNSKYTLIVQIPVYNNIEGISSLDYCCNSHNVLNKLIRRKLHPARVIWKVDTHVAEEVDYGSQLFKFCRAQCLFCRSSKREWNYMDMYLHVPNYKPTCLLWPISTSIYNSFVSIQYFSDFRNNNNDYVCVCISSEIS